MKINKRKGKGKREKCYQQDIVKHGIYVKYSTKQVYDTESLIWMGSPSVGIVEGMRMGKKSLWELLNLLTGQKLFTYG